MSESQPDASRTKRNFGRSDSGSAGSLTPSDQAGAKIVADLAVGLDAVFGKRRQWICKCAATMSDVFGYQCSFCTYPCDQEWGV